MPAPRPFSITTEDSARFDEGFQRRRNLECWEWGDTRLSTGYGEFVLSNGQRVLAHRFSLQRKVGLPIQGKPFALHSCDNKPCVNPSHLRWGTHAENMLDAATRGQAKAGRGNLTHCPRGHALEGNNLREKSIKGRHGKTYINRLCRRCHNDLQAERRKILEKTLDRVPVAL